MAKFKDRLFGQEVSRDIIDVFKRLGSGQKVINPLESTNAYDQYLGESTAFARMWTAVDEVVKTVDPDTNKLVEDHNIRVYTVNHNDELNNYGQGTALASIQTQGEGSKSVTYVPQLLSSGKADKPNQLFKPAAGITSVDVKTEGSIGATFLVSVNFVVHDKHDFDNIFLPFFLRPGSNICIDIGRSYNDSGFVLYDPLEFVKLSDTDLSELDSFLFDEEIGLIAKYFGYFQPFVGLVSNYDFSVNNEGSFECSVEIVSRNHGLVDKDITDDNDLKYVFNNIFDQILREVLIAYNEDENHPNIDELFERRDMYTQVDLKEVVETFFRESTINSTAIPDDYSSVKSSATNLGRISEMALKTGIFHQSFSGFKYSEELQKTYDDKESTYITLGKLEDIFLNPFVSAVIKEENKVKAIGDKYDLQYNSTKGRLRWEEKLCALQFADLTPNEDLPSFMLPIDWNDSYNAALQKANERMNPKTENSENNLNNQSSERILTHAELEGVATIGGEGFVDSETDPPSTDEVNDKFNKTEFDGDAVLGGAKDDPNFPGIKTIPIRELFISTQVIKDAFRDNDSVTEAIDTILDTINADTNFCWNIKMITTNQSGTSFCFHDVNLHAQQPRLIFDVTSNDSIVSKCDISFEKDTRLSDKLSIQAMSSPEYLDDHRLGSMSHINALTDSKKEFSYYRSLPHLGNINTSVNKKDYLTTSDDELLKKSIDKIENQSTVGKIFTEEDLQKFKEEKNKAIIDKKTSKVVVDGTRKTRVMGTKKDGRGFKNYTDNMILQDPSMMAINSEERQAEIGSLFNHVFFIDNTESVDPESVEGPVYQGAPPPPPMKRSFREAILYDLRKKVHGESKSNSVPVVLPIKIQLTVYGNNYLQIGDHFTINYLPEHYKDRTLFQIVGIEQRIEPNNWSTTYISQMKLDPKFKYITTGAKPEDVLSPPAQVDPEEANVGGNTPEVPVTKVAKVLSERETGDTQNVRLFKMSRENIEDSYDSNLDVSPLDFTDFEDLELEELDLSLDDFSNLDKPPPPPPPPAPKPQAVGGIIPYKDGQMIGNNLKFKISKQTKYPLTVKGDDVSEFTKKTWNHEQYLISDIKKFNTIENLAYASALETTIFNDLFDGIEINLQFNPDILKQSDYDRANYDKPDQPVACYVEPFSFQEMADIFNVKPERGKLLSATSVAVRPTYINKDSFQSQARKDYDDLLGIKNNKPILTFDLTDKKYKVGPDNSGDVNVNMLIKSFTFCTRDLEEGDDMYYFQLQNLDIDVYGGTKNSQLGIPKYLFDMRQTTPEEFIKRLNENYNRFLRALTPPKPSSSEEKQATGPKLHLIRAGFAEKDLQNKTHIRYINPKGNEILIPALSPGHSNTPKGARHGKYRWGVYETGLFKKKRFTVVAFKVEVIVLHAIKSGKVSPGQWRALRSTGARPTLSAGVYRSPYYFAEEQYDGLKVDNQYDQNHSVIASLYSNCMNQALKDIQFYFLHKNEIKFMFMDLDWYDGVVPFTFPERNRKL